MSDHDVATGFAPHDQRVGLDGVFPTVSEAYKPATRTGGGLALGGWFGLYQPLNVRRADESGASGAPFVYEAELPTSHLDLVTMQQRGRLWSENHSINENLGILTDASHRH